MSKWYSVTAKKRINISTLFTLLLNLSDTFDPSAADTKLESSLNYISQKAVKLSADLLLDTLETHYKYRLKGFPIDLSYNELKDAKNRIIDLSKRLTPYTNSKISIKIEDYPLLYSYNTLKKLFVEKEFHEEGKEIFETFLLLVPFLILSSKAWLETLKKHYYMDNTESKEIYVLSRALVIFFASLKEPIDMKNFKTDVAKTLALRKAYIDNVIDSIFLLEEGKIDIQSSLRKPLRVKSSYSKEYLFSLKRNLHEVLTGGISKRRKKLKFATPYTESEYPSKPTRQKEREAEYNATTEKLSPYMDEYFKEIRSSFKILDFLDSRSPTELLISKIISEMSFVIKIKDEEDYEDYSFFEEEIVEDQIVAKEGADVFYKYISSFMYWKESKLTESDVLLTEKQLKTLFFQLTMALSSLNAERQTNSTKRNLFVLMVLLALSITSGIDPVVFARSLKADYTEGPLFTPELNIMYKEERKEFYGIKAIYFLKEHKALKVIYSRRHPKKIPEPREEFQQTEDFWLVPVPNFLLGPLENILKEGEPSITINGNKVKVEKHFIEKILEIISKEIDLPFPVSSSILRRTFVYILSQKGANPLIASMISGGIPLQLHAPFYYINVDREKIWDLLVIWQKFLAGDVVKDAFPKLFKGRLGSRLYPREDALREDIRAWFSALLWSIKKRFTSHRIEIHKFLSLYLLLAFSGARIGEILKLEWEDIDFDTKTAYINGKNNLFYMEERLVPLSPLTYYSLLSLKKLLEKRGLLENRVFYRETERGLARRVPYNYSTLRRDISEMKAYLRRRKIAGKFLETERFHIFRHFFISKALEISNPEDFETIEAIVGHIGGASVYLWKYSTANLGDFLERSQKILNALEKEVLGAKLREKMLEFFGDYI